MNETKFRAYDKFDGMLYSNKNLLIIPSAFNPLDFSYNHYGRIVFYKDKKGYIQSNITGHCGVLMQYIELKDRKGKEIYVGDILKKTGQNLKGMELKPSKIGDIYFVVKIRSGFTLCPISVYGKLAKTCDGELIPNIWGYINNYDFWNGASTGTEIIGNIHENKELLK